MERHDATAGTNDEVIEMIDLMSHYIDNESKEVGDAEDYSRILKIAEELGEVTTAWIGYRGQNPRKGSTHTINDVLEELCDVVITAQIAIQHFTQDSRETKRLLEENTERVFNRVMESYHE